MRCRPAACPSPEHRPSRPSIESLMRNPRRSRVSTTAISVELVNAEDNSQIWGQQYNRKLADVFAVQEEIAKEISDKLRLKLTGAERQQLAKRPTENLTAFPATLRPLKAGVKEKRTRAKPSRWMRTWPKLTSCLLTPT